MNQKLVIGVDLGTSGTKAALYRTDGTLVAEASREVPLYYPKPGVVEQENDDFYRTAAQTVRRCIQQSGDRPARRSPPSPSTRRWPGSARSTRTSARRRASIPGWTCAASPTSSAMDRAGRRPGHRADRLRAHLRPRAEDAVVEARAARRSIARIAKFVTPAGYVAGQDGRAEGRPGLHGLHLHPLLRLQRRAGRAPGRRSCASRFGLDMEQAARDRRAVAGGGRGDAEPPPGISAWRPGTPIAAGCGDTAAGALGAGIVRPGMLFDVAGTAAVLAGCTDRFVADRKHRALLTHALGHPGPVEPAGLHRRRRAGAALVPRPVLQHAAAAQPQPQRERSVRRDDRRGRQRSRPARMACSSRRTWAGGSARRPRRCAAPGSGFSWGHTQAHFFRAILESVAYEYAYYLSILTDQLPGPGAGRGAGGRRRARAARSGTRSRPMCWACRTSAWARSEFGTWGSALIAGKAAGLFDDLAAKALESAQPGGEPGRPRPGRARLLPATGREVYRPAGDAARVLPENNA